MILVLSECGNWQVTVAVKKILELVKMGKLIELQATDKHSFSAYEESPSQKSKGSIVIVQEVFGLNKHIRDVCKQYAQEGYNCIAPSLYDRIEKNIVFPYTDSGFKEAKKCRIKMGWKKPLLDIQACLEHFENNSRKAVIGYCWGGSLAWLAAERFTLAGAVAYYGGQIIDHIKKKPKTHVLLHFGEKDRAIPMKSVKKIQEQYKDITVFTYPAGHGFNCNVRKDYEKESAQLAYRRTLDFLEVCFLY